MAKIIRRVLTPTAFIVPMLTFTMSGTGYAITADQENPWLDQRFLSIAHSGGDYESPENTMYAFTEAVNNGSDMLEMDVHATADDEVVVIHDDAVDRTTDRTGAVANMTLDEVQALDAAYHFVPGNGTDPEAPPEDAALRGVRTGDHDVPDGYEPSDFAVPTMGDVLDRFPDVPMTVEIKDGAHAAELLATLLNERGRTDVIVTSFDNSTVQHFGNAAPEVPVAPGWQAAVTYFLFGVQPMEGTVALQLPATVAGIPVASDGFVERAHADGYAVHIWFSDTAQEDEQRYHSLIDACVDGLMTATPTFLEGVLDERGIGRPGTPGDDPCA